MEEQNNQKRTARAGLLISAYHHMTSFRDEMEEEIVTDLLADLMHYCNINEINIETAIEKALQHFLAELDVEKSQG